MAANMHLVAKAEWVEAAIEQMMKSNQVASNLLADMNATAVTDITGFGLARHALNLSKRVGAKGCALILPALPLISGTKQLLSSGVRSSLHEQNREAVIIEQFMPDKTKKFSAHVEAVFDPQTSGGLLGVLPRKSACNLVDQLNNSGHEAAIIGYLDFTSGSVQLIIDEAYSTAG